ncbi:Hypothetical protein PHPALM_19694 [Phytophthora palmivora]|uniref:Uncharacterized protein n=1 Tax=Phytophthora palmivora TaxID=4796 RepID=A0A2P4XGQ5_9STRA|nr:Hypothetical protein PHPALM_19694 [Phytophthora palmivora]
MDLRMKTPMNSSLFASGRERRRVCTSTRWKGPQETFPREHYVDPLWHRSTTENDGRPPACPFQNRNAEIKYPDARQKKLDIRPFDDKGLYDRFGSGFKECGRRFDRQDVTIDLIGLYLSITAAKYYNKQMES